MKNKKQIISKLIDYYLTGRNLTQEEHNGVILLDKEIEALIIRQSEQLVCKDCGNTGRSYPTLGEPDGVKCESCAN